MKSIAFVLAAFTLLGTLLGSLPALAVDGVLEVKSGSLRVTREDGMKSHFYTGKYPAQIEFRDKAAYLTITRKDVRTDAVLKYPEGAQVPASGEISLDGSKTGQTFSIGGTIATHVENSETYQDQESCTYYVREWVCEGYGHDRYCYWADIPVQGLRRVEYHFVTKTVTLQLNLSSNNGGASEFNGQKVTKNKVYTYEGRCREI